MRSQSTSGSRIASIVSKALNRFVFLFRRRKPPQEVECVRKIAAMIDEAKNQGARRRRTLQEGRREIEAVSSEIRSIIASAAARATANEA